jgi:hypothetical protein
VRAVAQPVVVDLNVRLALDPPPPFRPRPERETDVPVLLIEIQIPEADDAQADFRDEQPDQHAAQNGEKL